ncbi:MAG TPA: GNAT family N-acetyltransferase [Dehalococcoidia bacterium]|nr:GNAT family N-acetyltransferase [Dehalococcoidia bacterium]
MSGYVTREDIDSLEPEWRDLVPGSNARTVFTSPTWVRTWWDVFRSAELEPMLLALRRDDRLHGVAPLMRRGESITFAGDTQICDYMDFTLAEGVEEKCLGTLLRSLSEQPWSELVFWALPEGSLTLALLPQVAEGLGYHVEVEMEDVCPRVNLPGSWEEYLAALSKKDRHELRRKLRRLYETSDEVVLEGLRTPTEIESAMEDFLRLHVISRSDKATFMTEPMQEFFRRIVLALAAEGRARLSFLKVDGVRTASLICFDSEKDLLLYNSGYDPDYSHLSVGLLSKALALEEAILEGKECFDFLRGAEVYKYHLGASDSRVYRCTVRRN